MSDRRGVVGQRVVVTGLAGSGKSTFARALGAKTGLPVIHLDLQFWQPGWVAPGQEEWRRIQRRALAGEEWIADGNYHETLDLRLQLADTVVVLDTPWPRCVARALKRGVRRRGLEMPEGCHDGTWRRLCDEWAVAGRVWRKRRWEPELERALIARHGRHATVHVLGSAQAAADFLDRLRVEPAPPTGR